MIPLLLMRIAGFFMPVDSKRILRRFTYGFASAGAFGFFESTWKTTRLSSVFVSVDHFPETVSEEFGIFLCFCLCRASFRDCFRGIGHFSLF